jgi:4-amino-4-deoxy-L-arabinose transferase-like glycosyltransferase
MPDQGSDSANRLRSALYLAAVLLAFLGFRALFYDADPPIALSGSVDRAQDFWLEPPAKAHEARNFALFGTWQTNEADRYQFWRQQSPAWVYPLAGTFSLFGVSYATLRLFSVAIAFAGFAFMLRLASERCTRLALFSASACLSICFYAILLDRSGLIEVLVTTLVAGMALCLYFGDRHPYWLIASQLAFTVAFFAKQGAVYAFPLLVIVNIISFRRFLENDRQHRWIVWAPLASAFLLGAFALIYTLQPGYQRTLAWNYQHMMLPGGEAAGSWLQQLATVTQRMLSASRYRWHWLIPFPIVGSVALFTALNTAVRLARRRTTRRWDILVAAWFLSALLALLVIRQNETRFTTIIIIPMFLLFGQAITDGMKWAATRGAARLGAIVTAAVVLSSLVVDGLRYRAWIANRTYQLVEAGARITDAIGSQPAVVIGRFSAPLVLETPYVHYYVKWYFNTDAEIMRQFGITHALWRTYEEETKIHLKKLGPSHEHHRYLAELPFRNDTIELVEFDEPLR